MYSTEYSERAIIDLRNAYDYIYYSLLNPLAAIRLREQIPKLISNLECFPYMGKKIFNSNIRFIQFKNYLILYSINNEKVIIQRIIHKRQNFKNVI